MLLDTIISYCRICKVEFYALEAGHCAQPGFEESFLSNMKLGLEMESLPGVSLSACPSADSLPAE